jgi:hypothetical protein
MKANQDKLQAKSKKKPIQKILLIVFRKITSGLLSSRQFLA